MIAAIELRRRSHSIVRFSSIHSSSHVFTAVCSRLLPYGSWFWQNFSKSGKLMYPSEGRSDVIDDETGHGIIGLTLLPVLPDVAGTVAPPHGRALWRVHGARVHLRGALVR